MVGDGVLHTRVLSEICRNSFITAVSVLLLRLLGVLTFAVPGRAAPGIAGEGAFHVEHVIGVLRQFTLAVARFEYELRHRNRCEDARFLLIRRKQCPYTLYNIRLGKPGKSRGLCSLCRPGTIGTTGTTTESCRDLFCQIAHPGIHPVSGTGLVGKPAMHRQHHFIGLRLI